MEPILSVKDLSVSFNAFAGKVHAVRDVSFGDRRRIWLRKISYN